MCTSANVSIPVNNSSKSVEFAEITEDIQGRIEHTIAVLNEGYANSNIPLTATIHCIEPAYIHDKGGSELIVDLHNLLEGDMDKLLSNWTLTVEILKRYVSMKIVFIVFNASSKF